MSLSLGSKHSNYKIRICGVMLTLAIFYSNSSHQISSSCSGTNQILFFTFYLYFIGWMCCSSQFPIVGGEALGEIGRWLVVHFPFSKGDRRTLLGSAWKNSFAVLLPSTSRDTPANVLDRQVEIRRGLYQRLPSYTEKEDWCSVGCIRSSMIH